MSGSTKALLVLGVLICAAGFKAWQEFRFATSGRQGTGTITKIAEDKSRGRTTGYKLYFDFNNQITNQPSHHYVIVGTADVDRYAEGQEIAIDYYGEKYPTTRLHGTSNRLWVAL